MNNEEKKQVYEVWILRVDQEHISVLQTDKYDTCFELWLKLSNSWEESVTNKKPFRLTDPIITAFDPGLIKEITIRPVTKIEESKYQNPYQQQMMQKGLGQVLSAKGSTAVHPNLLDEGYL